MADSQYIPTSQSKFCVADSKVTSSLNNYFLCNYCDTDVKFVSKRLIIHHLKQCSKNIENMATKTLENDQKICVTVSKNNSDGHKLSQSYCKVCNQDFTNVWKLRYHIRRDHFNLQAKIPYCDMKKVNQVWFEKVQNSNKIIEVRKTGHNSLIFRRLSEKTAIKVIDTCANIVDLSNLYPTIRRSPAKSSRVLVECDICQKKLLKRYVLSHKLRKHKEFRMVYTEKLKKS
ncbi:uncharacterized protein LOC113521024 [Galleria mellonella]|uniref:Uncharacterized protein LOC113521024 n=1 Tax=Galleria mellonella TaxID=7137 RepID=A0A6J3C7K8_GALME|nr:uncharacterized protein LOC113521024 [Galleria mellonella]